MARLNALALLLLAAGACGGGSNSGGPDAGGASGNAGSGGGAGSGGTAGAGGSIGTAGSGGNSGTTGGGGSTGTAGGDGSIGTAGTGGSTGTAGTGGSIGTAGSQAGGSSGDAGSGGAGGLAGAGGSGGAAASLRDVVDHAPVIGFTAPRPSYGAVIIANDGDRIYAVESRRDVEPGPYGLPWRSRFRLAAYDNDGAPAWTFDAAPDDVVSDVAVHASGDVTVAVLHFLPERRAYDLVRLDRNGVVRATLTMSEPQTLPASDFGPSDPRPLFRMKSDFADATVGGWVRLLPDGDDLIVTFLSYLDVLPTEPGSNRWALGLETLHWQTGGYVEGWARVVEGLHAAQPVAWTYDELRQDEQAIRPFLARDEVTGDILVGRAWNSLRCKANVAAFAEFTMGDCVFDSVNPVENELLPLAVTRFDSAGARKGTKILVPDADAGEQVAFALVARGGKLATAGFVVRQNTDGTKRTYPDPSGYVDYDGYIAIYDGDGHPLLHRDFNLGRGDVLAALRWLPDDIVAVGSSGWDRWQGGNSISRGADPLIVWMSPDGARAATRVLPLSNGSRHFNLHDVLVLDGAIVAHGFSDAPMTHSGDGGNTAARTFGPLRIRLPR